MSDISTAIEALKPFADVADEYHDSDDDHHEVWMDAGPQRLIRASFELALYRKAREAYRDLTTRLAPDRTEQAREDTVGVCYRQGKPTIADYNEAITDLLAAKHQLRSGSLMGCDICGDSGHAAQDGCRHDPLLLARQWAAATRVWVCFHCGFIASNEEEAKGHFGHNEFEAASCLTPATAPDREAIARIIDPLMWSNFDDGVNGTSGCSRFNHGTPDGIFAELDQGYWLAGVFFPGRLTLSLAKADAILSLMGEG